MEKRSKVLQAVVAHPVPAEQQRIADILQKDGCFQVSYMTHDGLDCLREVVSSQPDLVILDAVLEKIDGLEVLRRLKEFSLPRTKRVLTTSYRSYPHDQALLSGADYCILMPCPDNILAQRVRELVLPFQAVILDKDINAYTVQILRAIGARESLKGYYYARDGVRMLVRDPGLVIRRKITTELYGGIAALYEGATSGQVERALRTLTDHILADNSAEMLIQYFTPADVAKSEITNTAFLTAIANRVSDRLQAKQVEGQSRRT